MRDCGEKAPSDHLWWARNKSEAAPVEHKPLAPEEAAKIAAASANAKGSAWNAASTWEEKDISKWAHELMKATLLPALELELSADELPKLAELADFSSLRLHVTEAGKCTGDATYLLSRGKERIVYELAVKVKLEMELRRDGQLVEIVTGSLAIDELSSDDASAKALPFHTAKCETGGWEKPFQQSCKALWPPLQATLASLVEQAKAKWGR